VELEPKILFLIIPSFFMRDLNVKSRGGVEAPGISVREKRFTDEHWRIADVYPDLPGYAGRFCRIAWRTAMTIFRNTIQSNRLSPPTRAIYYCRLLYLCVSILKYDI
jgi:hypothetical protein